MFAGARERAAVMPRLPEIEENHRTTFLFVDGDGVGQKLRSAAGLHEMRRLSLRIHTDLHERLVRAMDRGWTNLTDNAHSHATLLLEWMGGDDLMLRMPPSAVPFFKEAFGPTGADDVLTYSVVPYDVNLQVEGKTRDELLIEGLERAIALMREKKQRRKAEKPSA
jgi:hypothetical protein